MTSGGDCPFLIGISGCLEALEGICNLMGPPESVHHRWPRSILKASGETGDAATCDAKAGSEPQTLQYGRDELSGRNFN